MSTRSYIGLKNKNNTVTAIYCHYDGYLEGVGATLYKHYNSVEKVSELLSHGGVSALGMNIGTKHDFNSCPKDECNFYHRDRGESWEDNAPRTYKSTKEFLANCQEDYTYLFFPKKGWVWRSWDDTTLKPLFEGIVRNKDNEDQ